MKPPKKLNLDKEPTQKQILIARDMLKDYGMEDMDLSGISRDLLRKTITALAGNKDGLEGAPITSFQIACILILTETAYVDCDPKYLETLNVVEGREIIHKLKEVVLRLKVAVYEYSLFGNSMDVLVKKFDMPKDHIETLIEDEKEAREEMDESFPQLTF